MPRNDSPFIVGDYWLDKRRDGMAPDVWQIATYKPGTRSVIYRSTKCRTDEVERAKAVLRAHEAASRSKSRQTTDEAELIPHMLNYVTEHGPDVMRLDTAESSFRAWVGWLEQDELTTGARVADLDKVSVARFRRWRMKPHEWNIEWWDGKTYRHKSPGVSGETVQRNIEDLRAALNHAEAARRIPQSPRIPSVERGLRSKPRAHQFTPAQLGALIAYADQEKPVQQWLWLMIATAARPDAALAFNPADQWHGAVVNLHPKDAPITDKRNAVVPLIEPLRPILEGWKLEKVKSRKRWWNTARAKLGIPKTHIPKTIRHTVASYLRDAGVPGEQISLLLGHKDRSDTLEATSERYAHGDPLKMRKAVKALTMLFKAVEREADKWRADHLLTITDDKNKIIIDRKAVKA
jgi:hypothetical protein